jgi:EAL domain-containing protein (putative c-di-GMP-specific phosphodiesterase class I)
VRGIDLKPGHAAMIRALVDYAHATGAQLCAEGVETTEESRVLGAAGVDLALGFLFGRPRPGDGSTTDGRAATRVTSVAHQEAAP